MKKTWIKVLLLFSLFVSCKGKDMDSISSDSPFQEKESLSSPEGALTEGKETYRDFVLDNVYHSEIGDIHYHSYVPEGDGSKEGHALFITLCGYGSYYFQGVGKNLRSEDFAFEALKYDSDMIVIAPQLNDWGMTSANETIALTEFLFSRYPIDRKRVYLEGYSGGGETLSLVLSLRGDLYSRALQVASVWDGDVKSFLSYRIPLYLTIGENDEYYGSERISETYHRMVKGYQEQGLSEEEIYKLLVLDVKTKDYFKGGNQHGGIGRIVKDHDVMSWLFDVGE